MNSMSRSIKHITIIFSLVACFICLPLIWQNVYAAEEIASGTCGDNLTWVLDDEGVLTVSGEGGMTLFQNIDDVPWSDQSDSIKQVIVEEGVTSIGDNAFWCCYNIQSVTIPSSLKVVGGSAFNGCSEIKSVYISDLAKYLEIQFMSTNSVPSEYGANLYIDGVLATEIVIPDEITEIKFCSLMGFESLVKVTLPDNGLTNIGDFSFSGCKNLTSFTIPYSVTNIGRCAFMGCEGITSITIPNKVTSIGGAAFQGCSRLETIFVPETVEYVGNDAFADTGAVIYVEAENSSKWESGWNHSWVQGGELPVEYSFSREDYDFYASLSEDATDVIIPEGMKTIPIRAFKEKINIKSITIPDSVTSIHEQAFYGCKRLTSIIIPDSVKYIDGTRLFTDCISLKEIVFPSSVNEDMRVDYMASGCVSLESVNLPYNTCGIGTEAFYNCKRLESIVLPTSVQFLEMACFLGCSKLSDINLPEGITRIPQAAFGDCSSLKKLKLPDSVISISNSSSSIYGWGAFSGCHFDEINIPHSLEVVMYGAGLHADKVYIDDISTWLNIETYASNAGVIEADYDLYLGGAILEELDIPEGVKTIPGSRFSNCKSLKKVTIPNSVETIGQYAFNNCASLEELLLSESIITTLSSGVISGCPNLKRVVIPSGVVDIEDYAIDKTDSCVLIVDYESAGYEYAVSNGFKYDLSTGHSWNSGEVVTEPTCKSEGVKIITCETCGEIKTESIPVVDHLWNVEYTIDKNATCTEEGSRSKHCSVCDAIDESTVEVIPKVEHAYGNWNVTKEATCTEDGSKEKVCEACGDKVTEKITATGHVFADQFTVDVEPTCTTEGSKSKHCTKCEEKTEVTKIDALSHAWDSGTITTEPTCTEKGVKTFNCSRCEETKTEAVAALGHAWDNEFKVDVKPTCTTEGTKSKHCARCSEKAEVTSIDALGHSFGVWREVTPSTCEGEGVRQHTCDVCGFVESESTGPKGHDWEDEYTIDVPATCTTDGSESIHCKNCEVTKDSRVITALGHSYGDWTTTKEPTCTEKGSKEKICSVCNDKVTEEVAALGHAWNSEPTVDKPATCTEEGLQSIHCARCNETQESSIIPPLGHQWNSTYTVDVPATESAAGSQSIHCSVCGAIKEGSSQVIPKLAPTTPTVAQTSPTEIVDLPTVKLSKPAAAKKKITVKWKKVSKKDLKKISGIQIQVATDPSFTNIVKTATAGKKKTSKVIKGLQSKTKYYVRIRAYGADNHVSAWKTKSVKVK